MKIKDQMLMFMIYLSSSICYETWHNGQQNPNLPFLSLFKIIYKNWRLDASCLPFTEDNSHGKAVIFQLFHYVNTALVCALIKIEK